MEETEIQNRDLVSEHNSLEVDSQTDPFTPKEAAAFVYQSFMHSQGSAGLQRLLFYRFLIKNPELVEHISNMDDGQVKTEMNNIKRAPSLHKDLSTERLINPLMGEWNSLKISARKVGESVVDEGSIYSDDKKNLMAIVKDIIRIDLKYQDDERPNRPDQVAPEKIDTLSDKHASFIRKYALTSKSTGNDFFDEMYSDIARVITRRKTIFNKPLRKLAREWNLNHPGHKFFKGN